MFLLEEKWSDQTFIAFDTETSGKYPLGAEICELGAVKWKKGKIVDEYQQLVRPRKKMSEEVIKIHNITNEMVEGAPSIGQVIKSFRDFIEEGFLLAHHAPFDMGFLALEMEKASLDFPLRPVLCTSLLARSLFPRSSNHKLQTLVNFLGLPKNREAHRALDDAKTCLALGLKCFEAVGKEALMTEIMKKQNKTLEWPMYSLKTLFQENHWSDLEIAVLNSQSLDMTYQGGSKPGKSREVFPQGLVRNPNGDYLVATPVGEKVAKRYFLKKISQISKAKNSH